MIGRFKNLFGGSAKTTQSSRKKGITALISCQNEELLVASCIASYLRVADEIIVVDNGSKDHTKDYAREIAEAFPRRVAFFEDDTLEHLYENRQFGLERSQYEWIIRVDSDYVCYTEGPRDVANLRKTLATWVPQAPIDILKMTRIDLWFDFEHVPAADLDVYGARHPSKAPMDRRVYKWFEDMHFARMGRWEGVPLPKKGVKHHVYETPHWMHCDVKSDYNHFMRSERTNWRELGDFDRYPTLRSYLDAIIGDTYGTTDFDAACKIYIDKMLRKESERYDTERFGAYPSLVQMLIDGECGYASREIDGLMRREIRNQPNIAQIIDAAKSIDLG